MAQLALVIDEDAGHRSHLEKALQAVGWSVRGVRDGETAVRLAGGLGPDLVVVDPLLPGIDGFETVRRIQAAGLEPLVVFVTGFYPEDVVQQMAHHGAVVLSKPTKAAALLGAIGEEGTLPTEPAVSRIPMRRSDRGPQEPFGYEPTTTRRRRLFRQRRFPWVGGVDEAPVPRMRPPEEEDTVSDLVPPPAREPDLAGARSALVDGHKALRDKDFLAARRAFERAGRLDPSAWKAKVLAAWAASLGGDIGPAQAVRIMRGNLADAGTQRADILVLIGHVQRRAGQTHEAVEAYRQALADRPDDKAARQALAQLGLA